jgi:IMP dehydrogenase
MIISEGLTFDDVLLVPQHSTVKSRSQVNLGIKWGSLEFKHPIIPANMQSVTGREMAFEIIRSGGLAILHRFMPIEEQFNIADEVCDCGYSDTGIKRTKQFAVSVGVKQDDLDNLARFHDLGVRMVCVDVAHGDSKACVDMVTQIKVTYPDMFVIAGNVATGSGARRLWEAGANVVKVGVGPGSLCTTRIETGNGVPQLTALMDVYKTQQEMVSYDKIKNRELHADDRVKRSYPFISDGGIKSAGDVVKALCFADMVMVGNLFAGCVETPGKTMTIDGISYKEYVGSSTHKTSHIEGIAALVHCKGTYESVLTKLLEGLRSGCSYQGAESLAGLKDNPTFIKITNAGLKESHPHDVQIIK